MNLLRLVLGLLAGGALLIGGTLGWARRTEQGPQLVITAMEGMSRAVYTVDAPSGKLRRFHGMPHPDARLITISPDGKWLIYGVGGQLYRAALLGTRSELIAFANHDIYVDWYGYHAWSADGRWLVVDGVDIGYTVAYPEHHLFRVDMWTLEVVQLSQHATYFPHHSNTFYHQSPDLTSVVYFGAEGDEVDLFRVELTTGDEVRLTTLRGIEEPSQWIEDWLIYWLDTDGGLYRVRLDGTGEERLFANSGREWVEHTPINGWLYFSSYRDNNAASDLYRVRWATLDGPIERLTNLEGYEDLIAVSPDEQWLYFVLNDTTLYRMRLDGSEQAVVADGLQFGRALGWSDDGTAFYFHDGTFDVEVNLQRLLTDTFAIESVGEVYAVPIAMTPDRAWMAYTRVGDEKRGVTILETRTGQAHRVDLPITPFEIFGWMPLVEQTWRPHAALVGGGMGLLVSLGMGRLRKWA